MERGRRQGIGRIVWAEGGTFKGNFDDDEIQGEGEISFTNGESYKGNFVDGIKSGQGKFTFFIRFLLFQGCTNGRMEEATMDTGMKIKRTVKEFTNGRMVQHTTGAGWTTCEKAKACSMTGTAMLLRAHGLRT
jgi:hypothetical protein